MYIDTPSAATDTDTATTTVCKTTWPKRLHSNGDYAALFCPFPSLLELHGLCIRWQIKRNWSLIHIRVHMHTHEYKRVLFNSNRFRVFLAVFLYLPLSLSRLLFFIFSHLSDTLYLLLAKGLMSEQLFLDLHGPISDNGHTDNKQTSDIERRHPIENSKVPSACFARFIGDLLYLNTQVSF